MNAPGTVKIGAALTLAMGSAMISFNPVLVKVIDMGPTAIGFYRMLFGGLALAAVSLYQRKLFSGGFRDAVLTVLSAAFFAMDITCWHLAIQYVGPGLATVLVNFQVFFLALFGALFLRERLTARMLFALPLAVGGLALLVGPGWSGLATAGKQGVVYGLLAAFFYAGFLIVLRWLQKGQDSAGLIRNMAVLSLLTAGIMALESMGLDESLRLASPSQTAILLAYGLVGHSLAWLLISRSLPLLQVSVAGLVILLQPTLSFIWDIIGFDRPTTILDVAGACLALAAIYLGSARAKAGAKIRD